MVLPVHIMHVNINSRPLKWRSTIYSSAVIFISSRVLKFSKEYIKHDPQLGFLFDTAAVMYPFVYLTLVLCMKYDKL